MKNLFSQSLSKKVVEIRLNDQKQQAVQVHDL